MDLLLSRGGAISVNPLPRVDQALSANGSDWLWAVTAIHLAAFVRLRSLESVKLSLTDSVNVVWPSILLLYLPREQAGLPLQFHCRPTCWGYDILRPSLGSWVERRNASRPRQQRNDPPGLLR